MLSGPYNGPHYRTDMRTPEQCVELVSRLEKILQSNTHQIHLRQVTKSVRIEYGKVGKECLSPIVSYDGSLDSLVIALEECLTACEHFQQPSKG